MYFILLTEYTYLFYCPYKDHFALDIIMLYDFSHKNLAIFYKNSNQFNFVFDHRFKPWAVEKNMV